MNKRLRKKRGLSKIQDFECWDLDVTIINFVLPRLKKFKEININSYPEKCGSIENWHVLIDKMIWSFQFARDVKYWNYSNEYRSDDSNWNKYYAGMDLFKEYLVDLWD
ncbi:hypothetical protein [Clostridium oryzae]|uniref:Uncharacterized protein n=1 Tax=Clostridium oryzae TaxID=1450648 RepID=A0A1V4I9M7_9CLOT|nr:hypothetical protein [Clostridium oryzae]OPJ56639.1 hypothetical protein CLORY_42420 [Clostridium oryzae]